LDRSRDIGLGEIFFLELSGIEIDRHQSRLAAERIRDRNARNAHQADTNLVERDVECLLFRKCVAADAVLAELETVRGVVLNDERRGRAGWKLFLGSFAKRRLLGRRRSRLLLPAESKV